MLGGALFFTGCVCSRVFSGKIDTFEFVVIYIHAGVGEVGRVEIRFAIDESFGEARVSGTVSRFDHSYGVRGRRCDALCDSDVRIPTRNRPVSRAEEKNRWLAGSQQEIGLTAVEHGAGW